MQAVDFIDEIRPAKSIQMDPASVLSSGLH
jgi:hypothetical protein